jgi:hypothetical protein
MLDGVMLLWFVLAALALLFVAIDIRSTPESPVLKWGFVLLTAYTGVFGAFLYVLGCREPLPGLHERYTAARWRQTLGSTMHCVAGDGVGILAGAVIASFIGIAGLAEVIVEYILGFAFGWTIFQALFMRDSARARQHIRARAPVDELSDGRHGADRDDAQDHHHIGERSGNAAILVRDVDGAPCRLHHRLPDELVAGRQSSQARHDDRAPRPRSSPLWRIAVAHAGMEGMIEGMGGEAHAGAGMSMGSGQPTQPPVPAMTLLSFLVLVAGVALGFLVRRI